MYKIPHKPRAKELSDNYARGCTKAFTSSGSNILLLRIDVTNVGTFRTKYCV